MKKFLGLLGAVIISLYALGNFVPNTPIRPIIKDINRLISEFTHDKAIDIKRSSSFKFAISHNISRYSFSVIFNFTILLVILFYQQNQKCFDQEAFPLALETANFLFRGYIPNQLFLKPRLIALS